MGDPKIDRAAWAREVERLVAVEAGGNKSLFARMIGVSTSRTIDRWLSQEVDVSEEYVRQVANKLNLSAMDLLVVAGYYRAEDLAAQPPARADDEAAIEAVRAAEGIPPALKRQILAHLEGVRADHERQRLALAQQMIDLARRQGRAS